jgi:hypothetical protein
LRRPARFIRHVDDFRAVHNLESLAQLAAALARIGPHREEGLTTWQGMAQEGTSPPLAAASTGAAR